MGSSKYGELSKNSDYLRPTFLIKDTNISILVGGSGLLEWSADTHVHFGVDFKKRILHFVLCLRRIREKNGLRIPKWVLFIIIKNML